MPSDEDVVRSALEIVTTLPGSDEIEALDSPFRAVALASNEWVTGPSVVGLGVAEKTKKGLPAGGLALKVYVARKVPPSRIPRNRRVPDRVELPTFGEVPTDVEEIGEQRLEMLTTKIRPASPGYSFGPENQTGTLGCLVRKIGDSTTVYALSNSHVLAVSGLSEPGVEVLQPGPADGGEPVDSIALLEEWVPFNYDVGFKNLCDAAIAKISDPDVVTPEMAIIGNLNSEGVGPLQRGMMIQKSGRTTGRTMGLVKDIDYRTFMPFVKPDGTLGSAGFRNQVLCENYSKPGDSGSLVCDMEKRPVGLHWCGSSSASVFSPLSFVCDALDIELIF